MSAAVDRQRRRVLQGLCAAGAGAVFGAGASDGRAAGVFTATDVHPKDYPTVAAVRWLGETLERQTGGRLRIRMYHAGQLGRESDTLELARNGAIDFTRVYTGALNNAFPLTRALCMPFAFDSVAHQRRVHDGAVGAAVLRGFESRGVIGLALYDSGARCFYNTRRPLHAPRDLAGLKLRVPPSDIFIALIRLLGGNPTPLPYGQVFSALETHLIDGAENNLRSFHASRHFETARYWSQSAHSYAPDALLISKRTFDGLKPSDRALLTDAARASVRVMREAWDTSEAESRRALEAAGVAMNTVDAAAFRRAAEPLVRELLADPQLRALHAAIRKAA
ncbi:TRAP transporter substrate-binding protein [Lysobacter hankyongensis]|uniref:TRAP transporter substrate-binding protein n=1 Tax=Lysobacter hankyongensis TaxID=1176535 RepID=A0ABP9BMX5_9GAMM